MHKDVILGVCLYTCVIFLLFYCDSLQFQGAIFWVADFDSKNEAEDGMILMRGDPFDLWVPITNYI